MGMIFRNRAVAGNICLVVFLAFMFTLLPGQAYANEVSYKDFEVTAAGANKAVSEKLTVEIEPISDEVFASTIQILAAKISSNSNNLIYKVTYNKIYNTVYAVYLWVYGHSEGTVSTEMYNWVYDGVYGSVDVPVKVWEPPTTDPVTPPTGGGSHRGGGSSQPPVTPGIVKKFADIQGHWAQSIINTLVEMGILSGDVDGKFHPNRSVTRAEFAVILSRVLNLTAASNASFADIKPVAWYASQVAAAKEAGIIKGYGDNFKPNQTITREEMSVMIARALRHTGNLNLVKAAEGQKLMAKFGDNKKVSSWSQQAVASLIKDQMLAGKSAKTIAPKDKASRAEAATFAYRVLKKSNKIK